MSTRKLLIDTNTIRLVIQEDSSPGKIRVKGEFARADVPTANGRIYPKAIWLKEINRLKKDMDARRVFCELDHPGDSRTKLQRVCGLLTSLEMTEDGIIIGEAELIPGTPNGSTLKAIMECNCAVGVSSRALGSVKQESGYDIVQEDFALMTFDFVADPANATSYPDVNIESKEKPVAVQENKEVSKTEEVKVEPVVQVAEKIVIVPDKEIVEAKVRLEIELVESNKAKIELAEKVASLETAVKELSEENEKVVSGFKGLGFSLYLERNLKDHPRAKEIIESLDFTQIESLDALKKVVSMHVVDAKNFCEQRKIEAEMHENKMKAQLTQLEEAVVEAQNQLVESKKAFTDKVEASQNKVKSLQESLDASLGKSYLLKKVQFHPDAVSLVEHYEKLPSKNRDTAKTLFESFTPKSFDGKSKFDAVRARLAKKDPAPKDLVENSIAKTKPVVEESKEALPGEASDLSLTEYKRLSGLSN